MKYSELSEQEKRIYDHIYALAYHKYGDAYHAISDAEKAIRDLRHEMKRR